MNAPTTPPDYPAYLVKSPVERASSMMGRVFIYIVIATATVFCVLGAYHRSGADPAYSRLATVYSLVHKGTFYIDAPLNEPANFFEQHTIDKVMVKGERVGPAVKNGRLISSKPPILPLFMTGEYLVMRSLLGWTLEESKDIDKILLWMTISLVGLSYVLTIFFFSRILRMLGADPLTTSILVFCVAFCTQLWGYSTLFNNHVPGTCALIIALYLVLGLTEGKLQPHPWRFFGLGMASAFVFTLEMPATIFVAFALIFVLFKFPKQTLLWVFAGSLLPLITHFGIEYAVTGSILPAQSHKAWYWYESSYWRQPIQVDALNEPKSVYFFNMTFGRNGLFSLYPVLFMGIVSAFQALRKKSYPYRSHILSGLGAFAILSLYYLFKTNNYGGEAYGFRWYIPAMPVLLLMGTPVLASFRKRWHWIFMSFLIALSFYSAWESTKVGWAANQEWTCRFLGKSY